ncbi:MAG: SIMPL domain-containing protein [Planctomycetota bacterium]|jgi:uncharacterized protein YggE
MERYIEITGEGSYVEDAARFVTDVSVEVRAAKKETAFDEVNDFAKEVVRSLIESGIEQSEIVEGGTDCFRPWYLRKKAGQTAVRKVILKVSELSRLYSALETLEPLRKAERRSLNVQMRQPEFESSSTAKATALKAAYADAKAKASALANEMECQLGSVIHVEEGRSSRRSSGFSGDDDWWGDSDRFSGGGVVLAAAGGAAEDEEEITLENPTRTIWVKCRVRFHVQEASTDKAG